VLGVALSLVSAALFGGMSIALGFAVRRSRDVELGAFVTAFAGFLVCAAVAAIGREWGGKLWPFLLAGLLAPLIAERVRPDSFRPIGLAFSFGCTVLFATRDNIVRRLASDTTVPPQLAAAATILAGATLMLLYLVVTRRARLAADLRREGLPYVLPGLLWGASYASLFEAFYRARVTVVSPLVATESLFSVLLAVLLLRRTELVGRHLVLGAVLIVAGGALIGAFR
jgi:uncharacterized membrane protein